MKVLLSAYACEPDKGSEPAVGWQWVQQIARFHDVWVITRANNRGAIDAALRERPLPNVQWIYTDLPAWTQFWKKREVGLHLYYYLWQVLAYFRARTHYRQIRFDVTHHVTFGKYWVPSLLWLLPPPFVFGPVGGGEKPPFAFWSDYGMRGKIIDGIRYLTQRAAHADPFLRLAVARAAVAIGVTEQTAAELRKLGAKRVLVHPQWAMPERDFLRLSSREGSSAGNRLRVISIGRLLHWKGFHLTIRAFAEFYQSHHDAELWIVSDGPERGRLEQLARSLGVAEAVVFSGHLPTLADVYRKLKESDVLVHPALHEAFGNVCLEAMAAGKPVICLDIGGPAMQVTESTGFKIAATTVAQTVHEMAEALSVLADDPELREEMGRAAVLRVRRDFQWDRKGDFMADVYRQVVAQSGIPYAPAAGSGAQSLTGDVVQRRTPDPTGPGTVAQ
jgi:glycosyltransferase involved in cell wall biosynthesis